jgi:A/G-specific adenine glycosylase
MDDQILAKPTRQKLQQRLLAWFSAEARELPWRGTRDLYRIWVSEVMLQQTQVATVIGYFERFVARFPDVKSLAAADEHDVLLLWEGLGYYRRARQLHAAARHIVAVHGGEFPETFDEVLGLPGIGRYTAGAILSIGRDTKLPILEANTVRVLSRLTAFRGDTASPAGQKHLWRTAEQLLPDDSVGNFNQALMELGATICTPRSPACLLCPVMSLCSTRKMGLQEQIPAAKKPKSFEDISEAAIVLRRRDGRVLLRMHKPGERWAGLWGFPRFKLAGKTARADELKEQTRRLTGHSPQNFEKLAVIKHGVTRFRITLHVLQTNVTRSTRATLPKDSEFAWVHLDDLSERALSTTGRRIARKLVDARIALAKTQA